MQYYELEARQALYKLKQKFPYVYDLNIYRGCENDCKYCYAKYSHKYLNSTNFSNEIFIKRNIVSLLEKELSSPSWKKEIVNIGGVTDSYQSIEKETKLMIDILKVFIKYHSPINIATKSDLILRDIELIDQLSKLTSVNIVFSITLSNEKDRSIIEPNASSTINRFNAIKELKNKTNASVGILLMPIIPYINDDYENLDIIYKLAFEAKADYVLPGTLYLLGQTKVEFLAFIKSNYNHVYDKLKMLYNSNVKLSEYKVNLYSMIKKLQAKYNLSSDYSKVIEQNLNKKKRFEQLKLF